MFGATGRAPAANSVNFVAQAALDAGLPDRLGLGKRWAVIDSTRAVTKADMRENDALPDVRIDPDSFAVRIDGELVEATPAEELPLAQRYFLF